MSIREFLDALRSTQGQHTLASVLEGPESGARLLLCEGVPVWPARPEGLLARNLPALAGCGASGILTLENKRIFVEKFGGAPRLVLCGGGHVAESVVRLAVMLGAFCGLRRIEMTRINLKTDLEENAEGMVLHVHGKGNKERTVYFSVRAKLMLQLYIAERRGGEALFASSRAPYEPLTDRGIEKMISKLGKRIGMERPLYPHLMRHTFASHALNCGMELTIIQHLLGHSDPKTTLIYAEINPVRVQYEYNRVIA